MAILASDIQLLESERMRDTPDGGGRMTGNVIPSGEAGNVFPKVSRVDSVYGRVNLRKLYVAVRKATLDMYAGAHAIITDPPDNDRISCVLFSTDSSFDTRTAARDRIESYVVAGPYCRLRLYGKQLIGQKAILCYQRVEEPLPDVGDVLVLSIEATGYTAAQQYVRITDVAHEVRTFTDSTGDFQRRVLTLKIGAALKQTFPGAEVSRYSADPSPTKMRITQVADASKYYGIQPLADGEDVLAGSLTLRLASIYAPLVPSTQRETAVSRAEIAASAVWMRSGGSLSRSVYYTAGIPTKTAVLDGGILPGSLVVKLGSLTIVIDDGNGGLVRQDVDYVTGTVDYATGTVTMAHSEFVYGSFSFGYVPAVEVSQPAHTRQIPITLGTRGTVYAETLLPIPAPGTLIVDYRALGRWYRLRDDGAGQLVANDASEGTGSIDYITGALVFTLGALPDVDSAILLSWGSPVHYAIRASATADAGTTLDLEYALLNGPVVPGSVTLSYPVGGATRTVTDAAADGNLTGTGVTGTVDYASRRVRLRFSTPPDHAAYITNAYTWRNGIGLMSGTAATVTGGQFTVPGTAPFRAGGTMILTATADVGTITPQAYITAGGVVRVRDGKTAQEYGGRHLRWDDQAVGVFDAATGVVTLSPGTVQVYYKGWASDDWNEYQTPATITAAADIQIERDTTAYDPLAVTDEQVSPSALGLTLDLTSTVADPVIAGSVMCHVTGKTYVDRGTGTLYADIDPATGSGTEAGSLDYETGRATVTWWGDNAPVNRSIDACLTTYGGWTAISAFFRTAGSPIRPASLYVHVTSADGDLLTGTADQNGVITGPAMRGTVQQDMGVVAVEFGADDGSGWISREVMPATLRYNTIVLANLPLDADLLGLDPVRLPQDGRVPIYRPGDVVVIHNTQTATLQDPVSAGATYDVGRTDLSLLVLEDADGVELAANRYVSDLAAGTVTMAADWDGALVAQPLVARHRIEDMALLADVQINGDIALSAPTLHAYPVAGTYVSSALLFGDLQAIVTNLFDQQSWTNTWSDSLIGSQSNAQYDDINHPIEVLDESAVTERWRVHFTSTTAFQLYGENLGLIAAGDTSTDLAPLSAVTGEPYFVLRAPGWGGGWEAGNQLRFNTIGAAGPTWIARTILGGASLSGDSFDIEARGDVD